MEHHFEVAFAPPSSNLQPLGIMIYPNAQNGTFTKPVVNNVLGYPIWTHCHTNQLGSVVTLAALTSKNLEHGYLQTVSPRQFQVVVYIYIILPQTLIGLVKTK